MRNNAKFIIFTYKDIPAINHLFGYLEQIVREPAKSSSTSGPTTKVLTPLPLRLVVVGFFFKFFKASEKIFFLSGPPPPLVVGPLMEEFFCGFPKHDLKALVQCVLYVCDSFALFEAFV